MIDARKISELPETNIMKDSSYMPIAQDGETKKISFADLKWLFKGDKGEPGEKGEKGDTGISIDRITVEESDVDGGKNKIIILKDNGQATTFIIRNGSKGEKGDTGAVATVVQNTGDSLDNVMSQKAVSNELSKLKGDLGEISHNLLDIRLMPTKDTSPDYKQYFSDGKYYFSGQTENSTSTYSKDLPLEAGKTYTFSVFCDKLIHGYIRSFDSSNNTLQTEMISGNTKVKTVLINSNATRVAWSIGPLGTENYGNGTEIKLQIELGSTPTDFVPHITANDFVARKKIEEVEPLTSEIPNIVDVLNNGVKNVECNVTFYQGEVHNKKYNSPNVLDTTIYSNLFEAGKYTLHIKDGYKAMYCNVDDESNCTIASQFDTKCINIEADTRICIQVRTVETGAILPSADCIVLTKEFGSALSSKENSIAYVSTSGSDSNSGTSRSKPLAKIQTAIDKGFKKILVREGVYTDGFSISGKSGIHIMLDRNYDAFSVSTDEDNPKIIIDGSTNGIEKGISITDCVDCSFADFEIKNCTVNGVYASRCQKIRFDDCIVHDIGVDAPSNSVGGFVVQYIDADFYNCVAYNIGTITKGQQRFHCDGFNVHYTGTTNFINCKAWNCEDDGISHHDACYGLVDGGEWYNCGKGGIATPTHGAKVNISNVYCHDNNVGIYAGNDSAETDRGNILMSNCVCVNNDNKDMIVSDYYKVIAINCVYNTIQGASNVTRYGITG